MASVSDQTAIVGIGQTEFSRDCGRGELHMALEAVLDAVDDAGLDVQDIDGMVNYTLDTAEQIEIVRDLGIPNLSFFSKTPYGGGGSCATVSHAVAAVNAGLADYVVCVRSIRDASGNRYGDFEPNRMSGDVQYGMYFPYGLLTPVSWDSMFIKRYMYEFDVKDGDMAPLALVNRENANRNPNAVFYNRPLTREQYMDSPINVEPMRRHDCCVSTDGAVAMIVTSAERAQHMKQRPAYISGSIQGMSTNGEVMTSFYREDLSRLYEIEAYGDKLFKMAGITPQDIDVAQIYDNFSTLVPMQLEALGFVERGEGVPFIQDMDRIRPTGAFPLNTSGGLMSEGYIHGMNLISEGVRQVRGTSTSQVNNVENVLVTSGTAVPSSGLILRRR